MSRNKHLYHVIFVKVVNNTLKPCASMNFWANSKNDLYRICAERYNEFIIYEARYIK